MFLQQTEAVPTGAPQRSNQSRASSLPVPWMSVCVCVLCWWLVTLICGSSVVLQEDVCVKPVDSHPAGLHLHVPLGPDHIVLVGGHRDPGSGTESGVTRSQGSVGEQRRHTHGGGHAAGDARHAHFSSPVSCFSRSLRGVCPPELQTGRQTASAIMCGCPNHRGGAKHAGTQQLLTTPTRRASHSGLLVHTEAAKADEHVSASVSPTLHAPSNGTRGAIWTSLG